MGDLRFETGIPREYIEAMAEYAAQHPVAAAFIAVAGGAAGAAILFYLNNMADGQEKDNQDD